VGPFLDPQAAWQHEHEDVPISTIFDLGKEPRHLFIFKNRSKGRARRKADPF
jgi:hypothetical protein